LTGRFFQEVFQPQEASAETKDVPVGRSGHRNSMARTTDGLALLMERELRRQSAKRRRENANAGSESSGNFRSKSMSYLLKHFAKLHGCLYADLFVGN
jgi:hypothetical protein